MDEKTFISSFSALLAKNGLSRFVSYEKAEKYAALTERLLEENEKYNLTAIKEPGKIMLLHYADSLTLAHLIPKGAKVLDVGTGAGFPALPLALSREDLFVTAMDSTAKRIGFVSESAAMLGLANLTALVRRAEDGGRDPAMREQYDAVCARGVAPLRELCEYCLPYVRVGGLFYAMKGPSATGEVLQAKRALAMLGGKVKEIRKTPLSDGTETVDHSVVIIEKTAPTNRLYPRDNAQIAKKPL